MIERTTILEQCEVHRSGVLMVKLALLILEGDKVLANSWHRTSIPLEVDPVAQMVAVNYHLKEMGATELGEEDIDCIVEFHELMVKQHSGTKEPRPWGKALLNRLLGRE